MQRNSLSLLSNSHSSTVAQKNKSASSKKSEKCLKVMTDNSDNKENPYLDKEKLRMTQNLNQCRLT